MKRLSLIALAIPVLFAACTLKCIEDSGIQTSKVLELKSFDKIEVVGAIKLILKQDSTYHVKLQADSNIIGKIKADVSSSKLMLKLENGSYCGTDSIVVYAGIGELKELSTDGAVRAFTDGQIHAQDVKLTLRGSADMDLNLSAAKLTTKIEGLGRLKLTGQAGKHELRTSGTARIEAFDFVTGIYDVNFDGSGKANINVLNELKVKTSGSSEIYYRGNPKKVEEKKSGAAKLEKVN